MSWLKRLFGRMEEPTSDGFIDHLPPVRSPAPPMPPVRLPAGAVTIEDALAEIAVLKDRLAAAQAAQSLADRRSAAFRKDWPDLWGRYFGRQPAPLNNPIRSNKARKRGRKC